MPKITFSYDQESAELNKVKLPKEWDELSALAKADIFQDLSNYFKDMADIALEKHHQELQTDVLPR